MPLFPLKIRVGT